MFRNEILIYWLFICISLFELFEFLSFVFNSNLLSINVFVFVVIKLLFELLTLYFVVILSFIKSILLFSNLINSLLDFSLFLILNFSPS